MNLNDESPTPHATTATQKTKLVWSTPRVVTLDNDPEGKQTPIANESTAPPFLAATLGPS